MKFIPNNKGRIRTIEQKQKYSAVFRQNYKDGIRNPWNKGKTGLIVSHRKGKKYPEISGKKHWKWKGGLPTCEDCGKKLSDYNAKYCFKCCLKHRIGCQNNLTKNKEYISWLKNKRNRTPKIGGHTFGEWETLKIQYNLVCPSCHRREPEIKLTEDHIIPLSKGGSDYIENIQPLCRSCNSKKHTKIIKYGKIFNLCNR